MNNSDENPQMNGREIHNNELNSNNGLAIAGFVLSFLIPLAGLIFSIFGLRKSKEMHDNGKGFAIAGIIISSIFLGLGLLITLIIVLLMIGSFTFIENTIDYVDDYEDYYDDSYMCDYAYNCHLDDDGMYSCKYENENGEEVDVNCYYDNDEFNLSSAIIGEWEPFLVEKDGEYIPLNEYYGNANVDRYINFTKYNFIDYTNIYSNEEEISGTYEINDKTITLNYYDGTTKKIEVDIFGDNNINLNLYDGDYIIYFS